MDRLERIALATFIDPPKLWLRYVDDTFSKLKKIHVEAFLIHLNNQHERIKFTTEIEVDGKIAFLDNLVNKLLNGSIKITIYRKATHTDQYLDFRSNHHIKQKIGIINTFQHRIDELVTEEEDKKTELKHVKKALKRCGHPNWALNRKRRPRKDTEKIERRGKVILPYTKGLPERLSRIYKKYDLETIHKPTTTIKNMLCNKMKDKIEDLDKTGAVYHVECTKKECKEENKDKNDYTGETDRVTRERLYEHRVIDHKIAKRAASINHEEDITEIRTEKQGPRRSERQKNKKKKDYKIMNEGSDQVLTEGNTEFSAHVASGRHKKEDLRFSILCTEDNWFRRGVKEAIAIRKIRPTLNKDGGRYHLSKIYDSYIRSSVTMTTSRNGAQGGSEDPNF